MRSTRSMKSMRANIAHRYIGAAWAAVFALAITLVAAYMCATPAKAYAYDDINTGTDASVTLYFHHETSPLSGATFKLYKVATVDENANFTLTGGFANSGISLENFSDNDWQNTVTLLQGVVAANNINPTYTLTTGSDGKTQAQSAEQGLYLLVGEDVTVEGYKYTPQASVFMLPTLSADSSTWQYSPTIEPKVESRKETESSTTTRAKFSVVVLWDDAGYESRRPSSVVVRLWQDATGYAGVAYDASTTAGTTTASLTTASMSTASLTATDTSTASMSTASLTAADTSTASMSTASLTAADTSTASVSTASLSTADTSTATLTTASVTAGANGEYDVRTVTSDMGWRYTWYDLDPDAKWLLTEDVPEGYTQTIEYRDGSFIVTNYIKASDSTTQTSYTPTSGSKLPKTGDPITLIPFLVASGLLLLIMGVVFKRRKDEKGAKAA